MKLLHTLFILILMIDGAAQVTISGRISDQKGRPVAFSNIYLEGSYDGSISDSTGAFALQTDLSGQQILVASCIGYEGYRSEIHLAESNVSLTIKLHETINEINEVAITAGIFSASDRKKSATLNSFDIASTASALGDIYGAYATMPGSQKVGEQGMLFVRGGESYETRTYMDGLQVMSPYFSSMPDIPTRGRFSPLLFTETVFSTGGYSAEYGQALSSVVDLTTNGLETEDKTSVSIMSVGASASVARRWERSSLAVTGLYANNKLHFKLFPQQVDWINAPSLGDGMVMYRKKIGESGLLKSFCSFNINTMQMHYDNIEQGSMDNIDLLNRAIYANTIYSDQINEKWLIRTGVSYGLDHEDMVYNDLPVTTRESAFQSKLVLTHLTSDLIKIRMGGDVVYDVYHQDIQLDSLIELEVADAQTSLFSEFEIKLSRNMAIRLGARTEYSSLVEEMYVSPRLSAAYKTGSYSQISLAFGKFKQKPQHEYLIFAPSLQSERADHYILNFQYKKDRRILRFETYLKKYDKLVKFSDPYAVIPEAYNNDGFGYAGGMDFFYRDQKSIEGLDYWISYSYLDTKRDYQDYSSLVKPSYASAHNLSLVCKRFFTSLNTFAGFTYSFASGRPYHDKNSPGYMSAKTKAYHDLSLNITYLTTLFNKESIIHLTITNLAGSKNVFGYRYSDTPDENGEYLSSPIIPSVGRQAVLLLMISL